MNTPITEREKFSCYKTAPLSPLDSIAFLVLGAVAGGILGGIGMCIATFTLTTLPGSLVLLFLASIAIGAVVGALIGLGWYGILAGIENRVNNFDERANTQLEVREHLVNNL